MKKMFLKPPPVRGVGADITGRVKVTIFVYKGVLKGDDGKG